MIKSKHFRKDVIIARIIFLALCALLIVGVMFLMSKLTEEKTPVPPNSQSQSSSDITGDNSEPDSVTEPDTQPNSQPGSEPDSQPGDEPGTQPEQPLPKYVQVTARNLRLRAEANTTSETLTSLNKGEKAEVIEVLDGWYKVRYKDQEGYLSATYVKEVTE